MIITVEISMYPLQENYRDLIHDFIKRLKSYQDIRVTTGSTATIIIGEYEYVMQCITEMLAWSNAEHGRSVFVAKFIPNFDPQP